MKPQSDVHVEVRALVKRFGGVQALRGVDLQIRRGSIHGLVGENGAGKSTLGRVIGGAVLPDEGDLFVDGRNVWYRNPRSALRDGIALIAQEIALAPKLTVLENIFLGVEASTTGFLRRRTPRETFTELNARAGFNLDPGARVGELRLADQQKVEILRALARNAKLIVMDEPTAALASDDHDRLLKVVRRLREDGVTIVYVSHFLDDVLALVDEVTVLKDGLVTLTAPARSQTSRGLVAAMIGREIDTTRTLKQRGDRSLIPRISIHNFTRIGVFRDVSFEVFPGEVVGIAGLVGSGRTELARAIFGAERPNSGSLEIDGRPTIIRGPHDAIRTGIAMLPESRKDQGLLMQRPILENVSLSSRGRFSRGPFVASRRERQDVEQICKAVDLRAPSLDVPVAQLSGGNQQKALFAKWFLSSPIVLIADEPTRGVDVGAKAAIHELLTRFVAGGGAAIVISSEFDEVVRLSHRVLVMRSGAIVAEFEGQDINEATLVHAAFGTDTDRAHPTVRRNQ